MKGVGLLLGSKFLGCSACGQWAELNGWKHLQEDLPPGPDDDGAVAPRPVITIEEPDGEGVVRKLYLAR